MAAITLPFIEDHMPFPHVETALSDPDGLLAFGGSLSVERLFLAYQSGIFPWFSDNEPILWWSPSNRAIITPSHFHISKSLKKTLKRGVFDVTVNQAFDDVINACATIPRLDTNGDVSGTWITHDMIAAYQQLHAAGFAHSIEVWQDGELAGGLYGVVTDSVFCGESMFHKRSNASKVAMTALCMLLLPYKEAFIDCQMPTPHLSTLGAETINRGSFLTRLAQANEHRLPESLWENRDISSCLV